MRRTAFALASLGMLGCAGTTVTREEVISAARAAQLGSRAEVYDRQTPSPDGRVRATVTYYVGDEVPGEGVVVNKGPDPGLIILGSLLLLGGGGAVAGGIYVGSSPCQPAGWGLDFSCAGNELGAIALGILGVPSMIAGIGVLLSAASVHAAVKKAPAFRMSVGPASLMLGGAF